MFDTPFSNRSVAASKTTAESLSDARGSPPGVSRSSLQTSEISCSVPTRGRSPRVGTEQRSYDDNHLAASVRLQGTSPWHRSRLALHTVGGHRSAWPEALHALHFGDTVGGLGDLLHGVTHLLFQRVWVDCDTSVDDKLNLVTLVM